MQAKAILSIHQAATYRERKLHLAQELILLASIHVSLYLRLSNWQPLLKQIGPPFFGLFTTCLHIISIYSALVVEHNKYYKIYLNSLK